jgi:heme-degrading monooxygenase HmoA
MFIAMNRFKVIPGSQADFERVWTTRDTHLRKVPGFVEFHLLRGPEREDHVLFASHTIWRSRADFEAWTKSDRVQSAILRDLLPPFHKHRWVGVFVAAVKPIGLISRPMMSSMPLVTRLYVL